MLDKSPSMYNIQGMDIKVYRHVHKHKHNVVL